MRNLLVVAVVFIGFNSFGQIEEVRRITKQLCSPEFHGRGYYKKGDSLAADYIVKEFKKLGIGGYDGRFLQYFDIKSVNSFPGVMKVKQDNKVLETGVHYIVDPSSGGGTKLLIPKQVRVHDLMDRDKIGAIIEELTDGRSNFNAMAIHLEGLSKDTLKELAGISQALVQFFPVIEVTDAKFTWSVGSEQFAHPLIQIRDTIYNDGALDIDIDAKLLKNYHTQNIMAYLPARKKCAKTVVFTAHYDHLGRMGDDTYFPGANDNASGTAMLLTMAKYFKENPSEYNVMFIAFAGEEAGLLGSKYFIENPVLKLKKIKFLVNLDIMGSGEDGVTAVNATLFEKEFALLQKINKEKSLLKVVKKRGPAANSDHYWFTVEGVPAFFIYTMGPNKNYHDVFDIYDNLSFKEYEDITTLLIEFVKQLK
ncbi:MAG: M20/M25/M40 family metallo-hydrolase [Crocinitomicaceae bacterium]|nr:M20/M25/M40 family metallo-hydrolase [Crocinitomicaceae bacterium]